MKKRRRAVCSHFISRVDYRGVSAIQCKHWEIAYNDRATRDAAYAAACCCNPDQCPIRRVKAQDIWEALGGKEGERPRLWPQRNDPT